MPPEKPFKLTHLTRDPAWIEAADSAGVDRIGIDIERLGKHARQSSDSKARISDHALEDLRIVTAHVKSALPFARLNPPHEGTADEVERAIDLGARSLMLPNFRTAEEVERFVKFVGGRAEVILLLETGPAVVRLDSILKVPGVDEVMVGLNDLRIELRLSNPMEIAASNLLDFIAQQVQAAGMPFGFGGVAQHHRTGLPVEPDLLLARYAHLGARSAWISRSFYNDGLKPDEFAKAIATLRARLDHWSGQSREELGAAAASLRKAVAQWVGPLS